MGSRANRVRIGASILILVLMFVGATASLLPLVETNIWWIRFLDFPRLQLAVATTILLTLYILVRRHPVRLELLAVAGTVAALGHHAYKLHPYSMIVRPMAVSQTDCPQDQSLVVMVANVKRDNDRTQAFLDMVNQTAPDLLLVMETDASWDERLSPLSTDFPHAVQNIPKPDSHFGMHLFSKYELVSPEFMFIGGSDTPTVVTQVLLSGGGIIKFIGLHPRPPLGWSQPTTMRDAHLLTAALMAQASELPTIVAGDFNAVPWARVTRRTMRIGRLLDPRVGRGFLATYSAENPLISWPLDHILFQQQFVLQDFTISPDFGSDHNAVIARLCHDPAVVQSHPALRDNDLVEAEASINAAISR